MSMTDTMIRLTICFLILFAGQISSVRPRRGFGRRLDSSFPRRGQQWGKEKLRQLESGQPNCEPITVDMCRGIGYNMTDISLSMMNKLSQSEAESELKRFQPLLLMNCSGEFLKLFLCSLYTPICMPTYGKFVPPCRFVCENARDGCQNILNKFKYKWPEMLRCERFPEFSPENQVCMHFNLTENKNKNPTRVQTTVATPPHSTATSLLSTKILTKSTPPAPIAFPVGVCKCECAKPMVQVTKQDAMYNKIETGDVLNCAMPCHSPYFSRSKQDLAHHWITIWSLVCFLTTFLTACTFLIDIGRINYPERPIVFMAICCFMVSVGFVVRIASGHEATACNGGHIIYKSVGHMVCSIVFILIYFFSMAGLLWWVVLTFTWFLAAGLKWGQEALSSYSQYYHVIAWLIPAIQTVTVLSLSAVDGDSLSGICFVGNQNASSLLIFVIAPMLVYLTLGGAFLALGAINASRIKNIIKQDGEKTDSLDKLLIRVGVFSLLYMIPSVALVTCYFYEHKNKEGWDKLATCTMHPMSTETHKETFRNLKSEKTFDVFDSCRKTPPNYIIFMVRYMTMMLVGIIHVVWIFSKDTVLAWSKLCELCLGNCFHVFKNTPKLENKEMKESSIYKTRDQNENEQLMNGMCHGNKRNSRSDTCLLTQHYHLPDTNIQSYSAPNVIIAPASNRTLITPISQLQTSHESFNTADSCSSPSSTPMHPRCAESNEMPCCMYKHSQPTCCVQDFDCSKYHAELKFHHLREVCSIPNHSSSCKKKCRKHRRDFCASPAPARCHQKHIKYDFKRPKLPEMRSKSVDLRRSKDCCYCHSHAQRKHSNFNEEIINELPSRLANSLPRTTTRPKSPDARICRTDQLHRKFR